MIRNTLDILIHYLQLTYSSRATLIFQIAMPLLFMYLIGQATGGFGGGSGSSTTVTWVIAVTNEDTDGFGAALITALEADPTLDVQPMTNAAAQTAVEAQEATAALTIPANFSAALLAGAPLALDFYTRADTVREVQPVEQAVLSAVTHLQGIASATAVSQQTADQLGLFNLDGLDIQPAAYQQDAIAQASAAWQNPPVTLRISEDEVVVQPENIIPSGINQSVPGMMTMFVTFGMIGGAAVLIEERQWGTLRRLAVMPIGKSSIIGGKLGGIVLAGIGQMVILIFAGALLFQFDWGNSPLGLALMVLSFALCMSSLGMLMAALVKTPAQANALGTILVLSMAALGGAWWPLEIVPEWLQMVGKLSPISWAMSGFHDIISRGLTATAVLPETAVLLIFSAVFLTIGLWRFRYE
jgi:ABC-2 type transport system permease protein